ncbi:MAG: MFS transporter, partial [Actinomycetota bacterium]|nr:MFS transporter [Actinomycetota bacterium]
MRAPLRRRDFRFLALGLAISQTGDWLYNVALLVFVLRATHSASWVAAAGIVRLLPYVLFGTAGGVLADRFPRRRVMVVSDLARAGLMGLLTLVAGVSGSALFAILLAAASTTFAVAYQPSVNAALPTLVPEDELAAANSVVTTITMVCIALGPAVGGILLVLGSPTFAFAFNAVTFLGSAAAVAAIRAPLEAGTAPSSDQPQSQSFLDRTREGLQAIVGSGDVIILVAAWSAGALLYGFQIVLLALVATERLGIGDNGLAFLYAAAGVGGVIAAGLAHRAAKQRRQGFILAVSTALPGLTLAALAGTRSPWVAYVLVAIDGGATIVLDVLVVTSLQRLLGNELLGRAFGAIDSLVVGAMLVGSLLAPWLVGLWGLRGALLASGGLVTTAGGLVLLRARDIDRRTAEKIEALEPRVERLAPLDVFEGASRATLETIAESLEEERIPAGTVVIRQGDPPDDLFVVVEGELDVTVEGRGTVGRLSPGD